MSAPALSFQHYYRAPASAEAPIFLLLHGTGGNEHNLVPLADELWPGAGVLSPKGKVMEGVMPRFFRRLAEGVFDLEDLRFRTAELAEFIRAAADHYHIDVSRMVAVGFSNGANIAASLLLLNPGLLPKAVLLRAMVPLEPEPLPDLSGTRVLMLSGRSDRMIPPPESERLGALLKSAGADVTVVWQQTGHNLTPQDIADARRWLQPV